MPKFSFKFLEFNSPKYKISYEALCREKFSHRGEVYQTGSLDVYEEDVAMYTQLWAGQYANLKKHKDDPKAAFDNAMWRGRRLLSAAEEVRFIDNRLGSVGKNLSAKRKKIIELKVEFENSLKYLRCRQYDNEAMLFIAGMKKRVKENPKIDFRWSSEKEIGKFEEYKNMAIDNCKDILSEAREHGFTTGDAEKRLAKVISKLR